MSTVTTEIERSPEDVFAYLADFPGHTEWQANLLEARIETNGPVGLGTRISETRRIPGGRESFSLQITAHDPPHSLAFRLLEGPIRAACAITVERLEGGRSRVSFELEFTGQGVRGRLLAPIVSRAAERSLAEDLACLKQLLETSG